MASAVVEEARALPSNLEAERAVLGAILLDNKYAAEVFPVLRGEDFFLEQHRRVYRVLQARIGAGQPVDLPILADCLGNNGDLSAAGGAAYLAQLLDGMPRVVNAGQYARMVHAKALAHAVIHSCAAAMEAAHASESPVEVVERAVSKLLAIADSQSSSQAVARDWAEVANEAYKQVHYAAFHPQEITRLRFGLRELDELTAGLRKSEVALIVGPTSNGKTLLAQQLAITAEADGYKGIIFSAEMKAEHLVLRELAYEAGIPFYYVRRPEKLAGEKEKLEALRAAAALPRNLVLIDRDVTPMKIWMQSYARSRTQGLDFVVVDYDQLVVEAGIDPADEEGFFRHQRRFVLDAKRLAEQLDICFVLVSQLRKMPPGVGAGRKPTVDDIYGDSALRNTPHVILWVLREFFVKGMDRKYERNARVYVVKSRNDRTGVAELEFDPERVRLLDRGEREQGTGNRREHRQGCVE